MTDDVALLNEWLIAAIRYLLNQDWETPNTPSYSYIESQDGTLRFSPGSTSPLVIESWIRSQRGVDIDIKVWRKSTLYQLTYQFRS